LIALELISKEKSACQAEISANNARQFRPKVKTVKIRE